MKKILVLKQELKQLSTQIRSYKFEYKKAQRDTDIPYPVGNILSMKREFRHKHIAYCQLRGKTRAQIERPGPTNLPDEAKILEYMEKYFDVRVEKSLE